MGFSRALTCTVLSALTCAVLSALLAGCGSSPAAGSADDVPFVACTEAACTGSINGAAYEIVMPTKWNGTLLLYSHGYRAAAPTPPDFAPVSTAPEPAPGWSEGGKEVGQHLLDEGYALAGSSYASNGWAVDDGVEAGVELHDFFVTNIGTPARVYAWGDSLGGLITARLAQENPWVDGAAPMCGVLAGLNRNLDLGLDVSYAVKTLLVPDLTLTGFTSYQDAITNMEKAAKAVLDAAKDSAGDGPKTLLLIGSLVDAPTVTRTFDGSTRQSTVDAAAEGIITAMVFSTLARYDIEQRLGGNPSDNTATDYATRVDATEAATVGNMGDLLQKLASGPRTVADPAARSAAGSELTGTLTQPTVTLHTADDSLVISANERWFADQVALAGQSGELLQLFTAPPASFPAEPGAPYGAGHCNFTPASRWGLISVLDTWVRGGVRPDTGAAGRELGQGSGFSATFQPGPWPAAGKA